MRARRILTLLALPGFVAATAGQRPFGRAAPPPAPATSAPDVAYDGRFTFARVTYRFGLGGLYYRGIPPWQHGYPDAEMNLLRIVNDVTLLHPHLDGTALVALDDPRLFRYPVTYMTEAGYWEITDAEVRALRSYLLKGGFLILDDTRDGFSPGNMGWANIAANFKRIFPELAFADLTPSHAIFHSFFDIDSFDMVRQYYDRGRPVFRALFAGNDPGARMMVLVNFNTDVSNYWEFSATGFRPVDESNKAYELGVNYLIYALTH